jgi:hypothetical protein
VGLSRAPQFITEKQANTSLPDDIWADEVDAVIVPANACGNSVLISLNQKRCQIITVAENQTLIQVRAQTLGITAIEVNSYLEAVGVIIAHKAGINPAALSPEISSLKPVITNRG